MKSAVQVQQRRTQEPRIQASNVPSHYGSSRSATTSTSAATGDPTSDDASDASVELITREKDIRITESDIPGPRINNGETKDLSIPRLSRADRSSGSDKAAIAWRRMEQLEVCRLRDQRLMARVGNKKRETEAQMKTRRAAEKERKAYTRQLRSSKSSSKSLEPSKKKGNSSTGPAPSASKEQSRYILRKTKREGAKRVSFSETPDVASKKHKASPTSGDGEETRTKWSLRPRTGVRKTSKGAHEAPSKTNNSSSTKKSTSHPGPSGTASSKKGKSKGN